MWSVDSQDWRITAGGQTEAGLLGNVTQWVNNLSSLTKGGGNSLMHDLNNVTVGAALKSLPILHPAVKLSPVSVCAGWAPGSSYVETVATHAITPAGDSKTDAPHASGIPNSVKSSLKPLLEPWLRIPLSLLSPLPLQLLSQFSKVSNSFLYLP